MWSPCERIKNTSFIPVYFLKDECTHCSTLAVEVSPSTAEPYNSAPPPLMSAPSPSWAAWELPVPRGMDNKFLFIRLQSI